MIEHTLLRGIIELRYFAVEMVSSSTEGCSRWGTQRIMKKKIEADIKTYCVNQQQAIKLLQSLRESNPALQAHLLVSVHPHPQPPSFSIPTFPLHLSTLLSTPSLYLDLNRKRRKGYEIAKCERGDKRSSGNVTVNRDDADSQNVRETNPAVRGLDLSSYLLIPSKSNFFLQSSHPSYRVSGCIHDSLLPISSLNDSFHDETGLNIRRSRSSHKGRGGGGK